MVYTYDGRPIKLFVTGSGLETSVASSTIVTGTGTIQYTTEQFSSTSASARVYEQIFTQQADPQPETEDWTNFICEFDPTKYDEFSAYCSAVIYYPDSGSSISPIVRAFYAPSSTGLSASLPVDGVNTGLDWSYSSYNSSTHLLNLYASTQKWYPLSAIVGSATEPMLAAVCAYDPLFKRTRAQWASGQCSALPYNCKFSGGIAFRKATVDTSHATAVVTSTAYNTAETSTVTDFCSDQTGLCTVAFRLAPFCSVHYSAYSGNTLTASGTAYDYYDSGVSSITVPAGTKLLMTASGTYSNNKYSSIDTAILSNSMDDLEATGLSASIVPTSNQNKKFYSASAIINHKADLDWTQGGAIPFTAEYSARFNSTGNYSSNFRLDLVSANLPLCGNQSALLFGTPSLKCLSARNSGEFVQGYDTSWTSMGAWGWSSVSATLNDGWALSATASSAAPGQQVDSGVATQVSNAFSGTLNLTTSLPSSTARKVSMWPDPFGNNWYGSLNLKHSTYRYTVTGYV